MKRLTIFMALLAFLLTGCIGPGASDWRYPLPNGYEIWRINSRSIRCLQAEGSTGTAVVERYVAAFCFDENYVGLQCVDVPEDLREEIDVSDPDYYLLDTGTGELMGPLTGEEFGQETKALSALCPWIATRPAPEGACYD